MAGIDIVDFGKAAQRYGWVVGENPNFGTGRVGGHAPKSYHYSGKAVDITAPTNVDVAPAYPGGKPIPWQQRTGELTWRLKQLAKTNPGLTEILGQGDPGHDTHVHVAIDKLTGLTPQQLQWGFTGRTTDASGKLTDVMPGTQASGPLVQQQPQQQQTTASAGDTYIIMPSSKVSDKQQEAQDFLTMFLNKGPSKINAEQLLTRAFNQTSDYLS